MQTDDRIGGPLGSGDGQELQLLDRDLLLILGQERRAVGGILVALIAARATDYDAAGVRITSLPITAEKVRQALREKQAMGAKEGSHA